MALPKSTMNRRIAVYLALTGGLFLLVRLVFLRQLSASPIPELPILDSEYYLQWAARLASGHGHPEGPFWLSPLYPAFIAGLFKGLGLFSVSLVWWAQVVLSLGTLALLLAVARRLFGPAVAVATGLLAALYAPWLYYDGSILTASLILFLNALLLWLLVFRTNLVRAETVPSTPAQDLIWLAIGAVVALSALARPSILIFAAVLAVWLIVQRARGNWRRLVFMAVAIAVLFVPVLIRNYRVSGSLLLTTSSGGINFFIGNRAGASGMYDEFTFIRSFDPQREAEGYRAEASRRMGRELNLNQASRYWAAQALDDMAHDPGGWLRLELNKLWLTLQREEIPNNLSFRGVAGFTPILGALPMRWGLLLPLAAAGMFLAWRRRPDLKLLWFYAASYVAANLIFFSSSEYRFPLILVLLPAAGAFFVAMWRVMVEKQYRELVLACGVYLVALVIGNIPSARVKLATMPHGDYYNMAVTASDRGNVLQAMPLYARTLTVKPDHRDARLGLANALWTLGNFDDARQEFALAGVPAPDSLSGAPLDDFLEEFYQFTEDGNWQGALGFLDEHFPVGSKAPVEIWINRAMVETYLDHPDRAIAALEAGMEQDPASPELPYKAARIAQQIKDSSRADSLLQIAVKRYPAYAPARIAIARAALARQDTAAARVQFEELRRITIPQDSVRAQAQRLALELGERHDAIVVPQE